MKKLTILFGLYAMSICLCLFSACQKDNAKTTPSFNSIIEPDQILICNVFDITPCSAKIKAVNSFAKSNTVGLCWSEVNQEPTFSDSRLVRKGIQNEFIIDLPSLKAETAYFVKAFVIIEDKPIYSKAIVFKTPEIGVDTSMH